MAAFNHIKLSAACPLCGFVGPLYLQTYVASDFDGVGQRFSHNDYDMGQKMPWFPKNDPRYRHWKRRNHLALPMLAAEEDIDVCSGDCPKCKGELSAVIRFLDRTPTEMLWLGDFHALPSEYYDFN